MSVPAVQCQTKDKAQGVHSLRFSVLKAGTCLFALAVLVAGPAMAQTDMRTRMKQLENQMETLSQQVTNPAGADAVKESQTQMQDHLSQIDNSLTALTGKVEEQQHQMQVLQDSIARLEQRLTSLEQRAPGGAAPSAAPTTTTTETITAPSGGLTAPSELHESDLGQPPQPQPATAAAQPYAPGSGFSGGVAKPADPNAPATAQTTPETPLGTLTKPESPAADPVKPADTPEAEYEAAYTELKNQNYDAAEKAFKDFLAKNPKDKLAANAQYWLGETYYARAQYAPAAKAFASAYQKYPQSTKGPDALLKMGMSLNGMGDKNSACLTYGQLKKQFPTAKQSISAAQDESAKLGCK